MKDRIKNHVQRFLLKRFTIGVLGLCACFLSFNFVFAEEINLTGSQLVNFEYFGSDVNPDISVDFLPWTASSSAVVSSIWVYMEQSGYGTADGFYIEVYRESTLISTSNYIYDAQVPDSPTWVQIHFPTYIPLYLNEDYKFKFIATGDMHATSNRYTFYEGSSAYSWITRDVVNNEDMSFKYYKESNAGNDLSYIEILEPTESTSTASRTIDISVEYYLDSETAPDVSWIYFDFFPLSYPEDDVQRHGFIGPLLFNATSTFSTSITLERDGYYLGIAYFTDGEQEAFKADSVRFNSATTTIELDLPILDSSGVCDSLSGLFDKPLCKTAVFLFYPSSETYEKLTSSYAKFKTKFPFSAFFTMTDFLQTLNASTTAPDPIQFVPKGFNDEILYKNSTTTLFDVNTYATSTAMTTIRSILGKLIYAGFGLLLFIRIKSMV